MTHLSLLLETRRALLVQLSPTATGFGVSKVDSIDATVDLYRDLLDRGDPKSMAEFSQTLAQKLRAYSETDIFACLNLIGVKSLTARFNRNLSEEEFAEECALEAKAFLRDPDECAIESLKLAEPPNAPFENHLLFFAPKRFLTRLQMMLLPSGKNVALIELSHVAALSLYQARSNFVALELGEGYLAISKLTGGTPSVFKHWTIEAETDIAFFATKELKALSGATAVSVFGKLANDSVLGFLRDATGLTIQAATLPAGFNVPSEFQPFLPAILPAIGCALKGAEVLE